MIYELRATLTLEKQPRTETSPYVPAKVKLKANVK